MLMPKGDEEASEVFFRFVFLNQPAIIKVIENYPNEICSDVKVRDFR